MVFNHRQTQAVAAVTQPTQPKQPQTPTSQASQASSASQALCSGTPDYWKTVFFAFGTEHLSSAQGFWTEGQFGCFLIRRG